MDRRKQERPETPPITPAGDGGSYQGGGREEAV
jgi:hypothetical protein